MSIELLNNEHWTTLKNTLENTKTCIKIISPFIGFQTAKLLKECIQNSKIKCIVITRFYREDFLNHASSLEGLKEIVNAGAQVYALKNLHTKLYLFDNDISIMGSANFTMGGFKLNHELSLLAIEEYELNKDLDNYFNSLLDKINSTGEWLIDTRKIEEEIDITNRLTKDRRDKNVKYSNSMKFGAEIKYNNENDEKDTIENIITYQINETYSNGIWLKFEGKGSDRIESNTKYMSFKLDRDQRNITCFPRNPRSISNDDIIYLCALSTDKNNIATPMITARARTSGFKTDNIVVETDFNKYGWLKDYPYYCELFDIEILDTQIQNCISLDSLLKELGSNLYPSTIGKNVSIQELKTRHYQKSHIRITAVAKDFIDNKFNELKSIYGVNYIRE